MRLSSREGTQVAKVCLPERVHRRAKAEAKKQRMSMTMFLAELVTEALSQQPERKAKQPA